MREDNGGRRTERGGGAGFRGGDSRTETGVASETAKGREGGREGGEREIMREKKRAEICPSLAFQDHELIIHSSKMQNIMHTNLNCVLHFIQTVHNYFTLTKICY